MGSFSYICHSCDLPIRSGKGVHPKLAWLNEIVAIPDPDEYNPANPDAQIPLVLIGNYDDYGKIKLSNGAELYLTEIFDCQVTWLHRKCWIDMGKPTHFMGESAPDPDQGWIDVDLDVELVGHSFCADCNREIFPVDIENGQCPACGSKNLWHKERN